MSSGVACRHGSDLPLLWLWYRLVATALIPPLTWEAPYAVSAALKRQKKKKERERERERTGPIDRTFKHTDFQLHLSCDSQLPRTTYLPKVRRAAASSAAGRDWDSSSTVR